MHGGFFTSEISSKCSHWRPRAATSRTYPYKYRPPKLSSQMVRSILCPPFVGLLSVCHSARLFSGGSLFYSAFLSSPRLWSMLSFIFSLPSINHYRTMLSSLLPTLHWISCLFIFNPHSTHATSRIDPVPSFTQLLLLRCFCITVAAPPPSLLSSSSCEWFSDHTASNSYDSA